MNTKKIEFFKKISLYSFLVGILGCLFFFIPYSSIKIEIVKIYSLSIGATFSLFFLIIAWLGEGKISIPKDRLILFAGFIPFVFLLSSLFSASPHTSLFGNGFELGTFGSILILYILFFLSAVHFQKKNNVWCFLITLFLGVFIVLLHLVFNVFSVYYELLPNFSKGALFGNLVGDVNDLAIFLGVAVLLIIYTLELLKLKKFIKMTLYVLLVLSGILLVLINLPLVWMLVGIFSICIFTYSLYSKYNKGKDEDNANHRKKFPFIALVFFLLSFVFLVGNSLFSSLIANYINLNNQNIRPSFVTTTEIAYKSFKQNPLFGTGPNTFANNWFIWQPKELLKTSFWSIGFSNGSSTVSTLIATTGTLGLASILMFLFGYLIKSIKTVKSFPSGNLSAYFTAVALMISLYGFIVVSFYNANIVILALAFVSSGIFLGISSSREDIESRGCLFSAGGKRGLCFIVGGLAIMALSVFFCYVYTSKFISTIYFSKSVVKNESTQSLLKSENMLLKAIRFDKSDVYYRSLSWVYINQINLMIKNDFTEGEVLREGVQSLVDKAVLSARLAIKQNPKSFVNYVNLGDVYSELVLLEVEASYENAVSAYDRASLLAPHNPSIVLSRAVLEFVIKNYKEAIFYTEKSLELKPDYQEAQYLLEQIHKL